ncbi:MAG: hypothetical protein CG437_818 [Methanosaeta sp. NSP1]|nr:MAG: hypothetical protein CG437_818 [Methanosaeta sp. NSP1]
MIGLMTDMASRAQNLCKSFYCKTEKERISSAVLLLLACIISGLCLFPTCAAQSGYEIRNAIVTPEYGYEDFTYSAEVWSSEEAASEVGAVAVTKFSLKLNIYNNGDLIHSDSIDQTGMSRTSFSFGPYNFENRFGISETENASFEFIFYAAGQEKDRTKKIPGPIVKPPTVAGVQFDETPYFFQGISVLAAFRDQEGLDPKPVCYLAITGPLGTAESRTWNSEDVVCRSSGKSAYAAAIHEDLSSYRSGGNFSFMLVYNNLKMEPLNYGPYNITLLPYTPTAEGPRIDKNLDYTNFTIQATVRDASASMEDSSPQGRLIISHPQKDDMVYTSLDPEISGDKVVFKWTADDEPALFNRSEVDLSKMAPFSARLEYTNKRWDFSARSSNVTFNVVEEIPKLSSPSIPENVYVSSGEASNQEMSAIVSFSKGPGDLEVSLTGPSMDYRSREEGTPLGGNKYQYKWQVQFDDSHVNNNYTLSLSFLHDQLEGGRYDFDDRNIKVSPVSVTFLDSGVDAPVGQWNDSYTYSAKIDSTVPVKVQLQVYDPCSSDWIEKQTREAAVGMATMLNWTLRPFAYECTESGTKYRFKAIFAGEEIASSRAYDGPILLGAKPLLASLTPEGDPLMVYVSEEEGLSSRISATVEYGAGQGQALMRLDGPDRAQEEEGTGIPLGANRYRYDWTVPFEWSDAGKSFNLSIIYSHPSLNEKLTLAQKTIRVLPVSIVFGEAYASPDKGRWNESFVYTLAMNSSVNTSLTLEVYNPCSHTWVQRASAKAPAGESTINLSASPFKSQCLDAEGENASFRFKAAFAGVVFESDVYYGPMITGEEARPKMEPAETEKGEAKDHAFNDSTVTVMGNVSPEIGVIQAWDEKDPLHALTYTVQLQNWSSSQVPWIELSVRAPGPNQPWKIVGEKKRFDPSTGSVSWTLKPFWETPFLGRGEYRFIIDGAETKEFLGPDIIAVLSNAGDSLNGKIHNFEVTVNSSENLTVCLVGGDSRLPENIKSWKTISQCQDYRNASGEQAYKWQIPETQAPPYYDFDIERNEEPLP